MTITRGPPCLHGLRLTSYLRDAPQAEANAQARAAALGERAIPTAAIVAETLVADWLVEIEVIAERSADRLARQASDSPPI